MEIVLKDLTEDKLELVRSWRMKPEVTYYLYTDPVISKEDQIKWFNSIKNDPQKKFWIINYNNQDIGIINIERIDFINKRCLWGFYIGEDSIRSNGLVSIKIVKELKIFICYYVFEILQLNKLCGEVLSYNKHVIELLKKLGSKIEGTLEEQIYKNNKFEDVVVFGLLKREWEKNLKDKWGIPKTLYPKI